MPSRKAAQARLGNLKKAQDTNRRNKYEKQGMVRYQKSADADEPFWEVNDLQYALVDPACSLKHGRGNTSADLSLSRIGNPRNRSRSKDRQPVVASAREIRYGKRNLPASSSSSVPLHDAASPPPAMHPLQTHLRRSPRMASKEIKDVDDEKEAEEGYEGDDAEERNARREAEEEDLADELPSPRSLRPQQNHLRRSPRMASQEIKENDDEMDETEEGTEGCAAATDEEMVETDEEMVLELEDKEEDSEADSVEAILHHRWDAEQKEIEFKVMWKGWTCCEDYTWENQKKLSENEVFIQYFATHSDELKMPYN